MIYYRVIIYSVSKNKHDVLRMIGRMKHILLVDDNISNLKIAQSMLKEVYKVSLTKSGQQALEFCERNQPDLILLDVLMPGMDGFETMNKLRENPKTANIPVVFLTGSTGSDVEAKCFEYGAVDFITKPFVRNSMLHRIDTHLQLSSYRNHLEKSLKEIEDNIINSFSQLIECKDYETGGHVERTKKYVELLTRTLKKQGKYLDILNEEYIELLVRSAPLHDIGKIGIRDGVLLKPGKLTDEEFEQMKQHTVIGEQILDQMIKKTPTYGYLEIAREIAVSHHERFDKKGYPYGLAGEEIPLSGRIMAVADVYDALSSKRVYRKKLSHEETCDIILKGKGTQFDPNIVEAFEEVKEEFYRISEEIGGSMQIDHNKEVQDIGC